MEHLQTQVNIRNNVRDMQTYVKDLYAWEADIKGKEEQLRKCRRAEKAAGVPAVRGAAPPVTAAPRADLMQPAARLVHGEGWGAVKGGGGARARARGA